jgi:hypothetical protein
MTKGLRPLNRLLSLVPKRAESRQSEELRDTFVDSGVAAALESIDHQVLFGRRGTGKTHALRYLQSLVTSRSDMAIYVDLRTVGSPESLYIGEAAHPTERAARLLVDMLGQLHESLLEAALSDEDLIVDSHFVNNLDALADAITSVRVSGDVEVQTEEERSTTDTSSSAVGLTIGRSPAASVNLGADQTDAARSAQSVTRRGTERFGMNFRDISKALRDLAGSLGKRRVWLLLDEWSGLPPEIQPYLAEFLVRSVLPLQMFTVKIGAIEQQSTFRIERPDGSVIGIELGADVTANVDLDEFMVFEQNEEKARAFFLGLVFKHLTAGVDPSERITELGKQRDVIRVGFTDTRAFDEVVRAAEGVPRDALNVLGKAALHAGERKISVPDVSRAAQAWYQTDKAGALRSREEAQRLLNWIIDNVIRGKKARGFLVNQREADAPLLEALFDARVLHIVRRGYSAQDEPGERYDVYVIDYGAYVDLMHTKNAPQGLLPIGDDEETGGFVEVPTQDLRSLRRAVLDLDSFAPAATDSQLATQPLFPIE